MEDSKPKMGRPRVEIDMGVLTGMCQILCTAEECAEVLGCSVDTIDKRLHEATGEGFAAFYAKHSGEGKRSLRRAQFQTALGTPAKDGIPAVPGNPTMQIWLGKQILGQKDRQEVAVTDPEGGLPVFEVIVPGLNRNRGGE